MATYLRFVSFSAPLLLPAKLALCSGGRLPPLSTQDKVRGVYENRIRFFAPPEKMFEIFSKTKRDGKLFMSYQDFLHAVTPFSHVPPRNMDSYLDTHPAHFLSLADGNGDGLISFPEFIFFLTLLRITDHEFASAFKHGPLSLNDFADFLIAKRSKAAFAGKVEHLSIGFQPPDPRHINATDRDIEQAGLDLAASLFQGKDSIHLSDLLAVRDEFQRALLHYQFHTLGVDLDEPGRQAVATISGKHFALSLLSSIDPNKAAVYYREIERMRIPGRISFAEFLGFHRLNHHRDLLQEELQKRKGLSKEELLAVCREIERSDEFFAKTGSCLSTLSLDILFGVLDVDGSGVLEEKEVLGLVKNKFELSSAQEWHWREHATSLFRKLSRGLKAILGTF